MSILDPTTSLEKDEFVREIVLETAWSLVKRAHAVTVTMYEDVGRVSICLLVAPSDVRYVADGRTVRIVNAIISAIGMKLEHPYALNIYPLPTNVAA